MKIEEVSTIPIWRSKEEQCVLDKITEPAMVESFDEREAFIIEQLVRKSLLTRVRGNYATYVYPTENQRPF